MRLLNIEQPIGCVSQTACGKAKAHNMFQQLLTRAMQSPEDLVLSMEYVDTKGVRTRRIVSPIRFLPSGRFLGLCLCRCEPRQFNLDRCSNLKLCLAADFVMPVPMATAI